MAAEAAEAAVAAEDIISKSDMQQLIDRSLKSIVAPQENLTLAVKSDAFKQDQPEEAAESQGKGVTADPSVQQMIDQSLKSIVAPSKENQIAAGEGSHKKTPEMSEATVDSILERAANIGASEENASPAASQNASAGQNVIAVKLGTD